MTTPQGGPYGPGPVTPGPGAPGPGGGPAPADDSGAPRPGGAGLDVPGFDAPRADREPYLGREGSGAGGAGPYGPGPVSPPPAEPAPAAPAQHASVPEAPRPAASPQPRYDDGGPPSVATPSVGRDAAATQAIPATPPRKAASDAARATAKPDPTAQPLRTKPRRARLVVRRVDPWSVLKFSLLFSICLLIVFVVAVAALYYALDSLGVFDSVNQFVRDVTQAGTDTNPTGGFDVTFSAGRIIGGAAVIGAINVVIITAISTLGAFLYNLCSDIVGGIELTLAERD